MSALLIGLPVSLAGLSYEFGVKKGVARSQTAAETQASEDARERAEALADMAVEAERRLESMTLLLAELQSRVTRLDAVGMNLTTRRPQQTGRARRLSGIKTCLPVWFSTFWAARRFSGSK